jgi:hypothetical protein
MRMRKTISATSSSNWGGCLSLRTGAAHQSRLRPDPQQSGERPAAARADERDQAPLRGGVAPPARLRKGPRESRAPAHRRVRPAHRPIAGSARPAGSKSESSKDLLQFQKRPGR